ncbi:hypothetical protein F5Y12DRAFT_755966 [Xylaria sp. FL1777]|nr:hypothetical protein F5Y12DRAFT_755966 [Xylaria sp. FL1777]
MFQFGCTSIALIERLLFALLSFHGFLKQPLQTSSQHLPNQLYSSAGLKRDCASLEYFFFSQLVRSKTWVR